MNAQNLQPDNQSFWIYKEDKNVKENLYDKYFKDTVSPKNFDSNYIFEIKDEKDKVIGRKFLTEDKKVGYYEIYEDSICNLINHVNKRVTFLFSPKSIDEKEYQLNERIGFRYYENI